MKALTSNKMTLDSISGQSKQYFLCLCCFRSMTTCVFDHSVSYCYSISISINSTLVISLMPPGGFNCIFMLTQFTHHTRALSHCATV